MVIIMDYNLNRTFQSSWLGAIGTKQWQFNMWKIIVCGVQYMERLFSDL